MTIKDIKGLKYPDEYMIKYFFKERLFESKGKVLEFGCSNGNNLSLFYQYDYDTYGVDINEINIKNAKYNFENIYESEGSFTFYSDDMISFVQNNKDLEVDVFMIPNVISYISKEDFIKFLEISVENNIFKKGAKFFLRTRTRKDYRYGLGKKVAEDSYLMQNNITGEEGAICTCYQEYELIDILRKYLNLSNFSINHLDNQNCQNGETILNSDIAIWGDIE
ncbi:methyltransferase domain-containing protein [Arcobacter sp. YIC-464]|uniref:methyltransferase domain-containing protein n=1 Tax=Arcobacter sp. YIC-464 TaxID=3376631 RepID=UPI003C170BAD